MSDVAVTLDIDAPADRVWAAITDADAVAEWLTVHCEYVDDPPRELRPGVAFRERLATEHHDAEIRWRIDEVRAPRRLAASGEGPYGSGARMVYELGEVDGRTRLEFRTALSLPGGPLGAIARRFARPRGQQEAERSLQRLRRQVEDG